MSQYPVDDIDQIYGELPSLWQLTKLDELIHSKKADLQTGPFGTMLHASSYKEQGTPVLAVQHVGNNRINHASDIPRVDRETFDRLARYEIKKDDIIFCRKGAVERVALVTKSEDGWLQGSDCIRLRIADKSLLDPAFFSYIFCSHAYKRWIVRHAHGATMPSLNQKILGLSPIPLPSIKEQREIANILSLLDRKIENLRKQNETLEAIAQTLFKHWFIDFEFPNADGKPYKSSGGAMEPSELGEIPAGWPFEPFETTFLVPQRTGLTKPSRIRGEGVYMVNMGELFKNKRIGDLEMDRVPLSKSEFDKSRLEFGDLLFARRSLTREGAGQCSIITEAPEERVFEGSLIRCRTNPKKANPFYFFYHFWSFVGSYQINSLVEQVAVAGIRGSELAKLEVVVPPIELQNQFFRVVEPMEKSIALNLRHIRTLTQTRDALLPKLMSGKLRIQED